MRRWGSLVACGLAACLRPAGYRCDDDAQCVRTAGGSCEAGGCAYPDAMCDGVGLRWDALAPDELAGACVGEAGSSEAGSSGSGQPPVSSCGNDMIDEGEDCDDGNRLPGDTCHPQCVAAGTLLWQVTYDGEAHTEDKGYGLAIDAEAASFYVAGFTTITAAGGNDMLLQKRWIEDGSLQWSRTHAGDAGGDDFGENVALDRAGNPVLAGMAIGEATGADIVVRKYDAEGELAWSVSHDEEGRFDHGQGIAITSTGAIVVVGNVEHAREGDVVDLDAWMQLYDGEGIAVGAPIERGSPGMGDEAIDVEADGDGWLVTGRLSDVDDHYTVWTARYEHDGVLRWEDLASTEPIGDETRGIGVGLDPDGGSATAGVLSNDIWVRRYDAFGTIGETLTVAGATAMHDEATDVAFAADGSFVVVGFVDYATEGFRTGDCWVRVYEPDGSERWTDVYDGPAHEIDKALAVAVTADHSLVVVGYETVPGQARDVWMRRYAM